MKRKYWREELDDVDICFLPFKSLLFELQARAGTPTSSLATIPLGWMGIASSRGARLSSSRTDSSTATC